MTYLEYLIHVKDAKKLRSSDELLANIGFGADIPYSAPNWERVCEIMFAAAHGDFSVLVGKMSARAFGLRFELPERTVQNWISGSRTAPDYVLLLIGYALIGNIPQKEISD